MGNPVLHWSTQNTTVFWRGEMIYHYCCICTEILYKYSSKSLIFWFLYPRIISAFASLIHFASQQNTLLLQSLLEKLNASPPKVHQVQQVDSQTSLSLVFFPLWRPSQRFRKCKESKGRSAESREARVKQTQQLGRGWPAVPLCCVKKHNQTSPNRLWSTFHYIESQQGPACSFVVDIYLSNGIIPRMVAQ